MSQVSKIVFAIVNLIKCLKDHKSLGSLCSVMKGLIVSDAQQTKEGTCSPIELSVDS